MARIGRTGVTAQPTQAPTGAIPTDAQWLERTIELATANVRRAAARSER